MAPHPSPLPAWRPRPAPAWPWLALLLLTAAAASKLPQQDINTLNCFDLVDETQWGLVVGLDPGRASLAVEVAGAGPPVITCLNRQTVRYLVSLVGDTHSQPFLLAGLHSWEGVAAELVANPPTFTYLIYGGRYRLQLTHCGHSPACSQATDTKTVFSDFVNIQASVEPECRSGAAAVANSSAELLGREQAGVAAEGRAEFRLSYSPCSAVQPYDEAAVSLYSAVSMEECGPAGLALVSATVPVTRGPAGQAALLYTAPSLPGDRYYCLLAQPSHIACRLAGPRLPAPAHCSLLSGPVWLPARSALPARLPFCPSHLACAWLYIAVAGAAGLLLSFCLACCCVRCADTRRRASATRRDQVDFGGDAISLAGISERQSWAELHKEWESREDKARGKILLLYSPDTKLFRELQENFKSFLDLACHCDIYDLFDDALFDTIALDPSEWLQEFVNDPDVKIVVISSIGAHRRQLALAGEQPLNLPDNSLLDGLFTSGLRFISSYPGLAASGRVATARYELLHLTEEAHKLGPPLSGPNTREFLVPTQLHELFCWVHHLKPLDLMGKPWANYHLEMQLLQDGLKLVRRDRTGMSSSRGSGPSQPANFTDLGNGVTRI